MPEMRVTNVGPHANRGLGNVFEQANLAGVIHAEFHDGDIGAMAKLEERQRKPEMVVQVAAILHNPVARREDRCDQFLGRRLTCAAGDGDHGGARLAPHESCEILECSCGVGDLNDRRIARVRAPALVNRLATRARAVRPTEGLGFSRVKLKPHSHHCARRTATQGIGDKLVPITSGDDGEEQIAGGK